MESEWHVIYTLLHGIKTDFVLLDFMINSMTPFVSMLSSLRWIPSGCSQYLQDKKFRRSTMSFSDVKGGLYSEASNRKCAAEIYMCKC